MREKLQLILCVLTCVFFGITFIALVTMGFADAKVLLGRVILGSLIAGAGCVAVLIGALVPDIG